MSSHNAAAPYYFVPGPSKWPLLAGMSLLTTMIGASGWVNDASWGPVVNYIGLASIIAVLYFWFGDAIKESESGQYGQRVDHSYRWSMAWFIFSEVMFFGAFFGALFYARTITMPWLGDLDHKFIWPDFAAHWGNVGPAGTVQEFKTMGPFPIPTINTALLLTSGLTLTISHHALRAGHRAQTAFWLFATIALGAIFMGFQAFEYHHAYTELNLKLTSGIYGSTFFMLDRLPRLPRDDGRDHAVGGAGARAARPLHGGQPLRLRRRGLVLALCRRRLARPVRRRLLAVTTI